jgi:hypothetical protein
MDEIALQALIVAMLRAGTIPEDVIHDAANELDERNEVMAAHRLRCLLLEANSPTAAQRKAEARRPRLEVLDGGNGG